MKLSDFGTAHINGLRSSIQALEVQVTILKNLLAGDSADSDSADQMEEAKEEDFAPKKKKAKKSAAFEEEETEETNSDDAPAEEQEEEIAPKKSKKKTPSFDEEEEEEEEEAAPAPKKGKLTIDDVNDACLAAAKKLGDRKPVLALLKKEFQVTSVQNLEKNQYGELITALGKLKK